MEEKSYSQMGAWWDRKGENEIDLVCKDEFAEIIDFYEIKRDPSRIDLGKLKLKAERFFEKQPELRSLAVNYRALSLSDM